MSQFLEKMKEFEGYTPRAQWDYKQHTNGYGTRARFPGESIDREEAERRFQDETSKAGAFVDSLGVPMTEGQRAALVDLTFNAGTKWADSGLGQAVRGGDWGKASSLFTQYNKAGGATLPGLVSRRAEGASWMRDGGPQAAPTEAAMNGPAPIHQSGYGRNPTDPANAGGTYGPPPPPTNQGAFASMQAKFGQSPLGVLASGLERGDSTDIQAGLKDVGSGALGAFAQGFGAGSNNEPDGQLAASMSKSAADANASALASAEQQQAQALQAMMARRRGAFA